MASKDIKMWMAPQMRDLVRSEKFIKVAYGGRGSSKSYTIAMILVLKALQGKHNILCCRETQNSISDSSLGVIKSVISDFGLDEYFEETRHTLKSYTGSKFIFRGLNHPHRIKSLEAIDIAWIDEADSVSADSWEVLLPTVRKEGAQVWVSFNPQYKTDFVYQEFVEKQSDLVDARLINYHDNEYVSSTLMRQIEYMKANDYEKYLHVFEGRPIEHNEAQIFKGRYKVISSAYFQGILNDKRHIIGQKESNNDDIIRINPSFAGETPLQSGPSDGMYYIGIDFGFNDPTVITRAWVSDENELVIDYEFYEVGLDISRLPEELMRVPGWETAIIVADNARPETISYINNRIPKNRVRASSKGRNSVIEGIEHLKSFKQIFIMSDCKNTCEEFLMYSYKVDKRTGLITNIPEDKHNHAIDSLRYSLHKAENTGVARIEFVKGLERLL